MINWMPTSSAGLLLADADGLIPIAFVVVFVVAWGANAFRAAKNAAKAKSNPPKYPSNPVQGAVSSASLSLDEMLRKAREKAEEHRTRIEQQRQGSLLPGQVPPSLNTMLPNPMPPRQWPPSNYKPPAGSLARAVQAQQPKYQQPKAQPPKYQQPKAQPRNQVKPARKSNIPPPRPLGDEARMAASRAVLKAEETEAYMVREMAIPAGTRPIGQENTTRVQAGHKSMVAGLSIMGDRKHLREAIVLSEILQAPVSMRDPLKREF